MHSSRTVLLLLCAHTVLALKDLDSNQDYSDHTPLCKSANNATATSRQSAAASTSTTIVQLLITRTISPLPGTNIPGNTATAIPIVAPEPDPSVLAGLSGTASSVASAETSSSTPSKLATLVASVTTSTISTSILVSLLSTTNAASSSIIPAVTTTPSPVDGIPTSGLNTLQYWGSSMTTSGQISTPHPGTAPKFVPPSISNSSAPYIITHLNVTTSEVEGTLITNLTAAISQDDDHDGKADHLEIDTIGDVFDTTDGQETTVTTQEEENLTYNADGSTTSVGLTATDSATTSSNDVGGDKYDHLVDLLEMQDQDMTGDGGSDQGDGGYTDPYSEQDPGLCSVPTNSTSAPAYTPSAAATSSASTSPITLETLFTHSATTPEPLSPAPASSPAAYGDYSIPLPSSATTPCPLVSTDTTAAPTAIYPTSVPPEVTSYTGIVGEDYTLSAAAATATTTVAAVVAVEVGTPAPSQPQGAPPALQSASTATQDVTQTHVVYAMVTVTATATATATSGQSVQRSGDGHDEAAAFGTGAGDADQGPHVKYGNAVRGQTGDPLVTSSTGVVFTTLVTRVRRGVV